MPTRPYGVGVDVPGTPLRDQQVTFDITCAEARAANTSQRQRLLTTLRGLTSDQWRAVSRCADWSVQDVVRHVTQMSDLMHRGIEAAGRGERFTPFKAFDPKVTPTELVRAGGDEDPAATVRGFDRSTTSLVAALDDLDDDDATLLATPAGRQPWRRAVLHALFDSSVHERDITVPLGLSADASVDEIGAIAAYQVLLAARVACAFGGSFAVELALDGAPALTARVDGPSVAVTRESGTGAPVAHGDAVAVLDAMTGRGELADVLDAPPDVIAGLGTLRALV